MELEEEPLKGWATRKSTIATTMGTIMRLKAFTIS
jgi:hypothetical protein